MSNPIKETPVLTGKDAERFQKEIKLSLKNRVSINERERMLKNFHAIEAIVKG